MPIANENLKGNIRTTYFEESPIMSTYLVAVVIGAFDYIEETTADGRHTRHSLTPQKRNNNVVLSYCTVRAGIKVTRNQKTAKCSLFWFGKKVFMISAVIMLLKPAFGPHLGTSQLLSHFQNWIIAVSEFAGKAMENHWLIIYRENELLHDDLLSSAASKKRLVIVVSREVARHWFGNLVTMEWWTHLWLNEGFATWVSYMATDIMFPEWKIWSQFLELTTDGLPVDALDQSHPIEVEVHQARTILEIADDISYNKGSAVIRMLQVYLGDHMFQICYKVVQISGDAIPDLLNELKQFFMNILLFSSEKSGWESISGENHSSALLRGEVLMALSTFGHDKTHKEAASRHLWMIEILHSFQLILKGLLTWL